MAVREHLGKDVLGEGTEVAGEGNAALSDHLQVGLHLQPLIAGPTDQHLVKNDPQGPDIALFGVEVVHVGFGCHVLGRSDVIEHLRLVGHLRHLAVAEVDDCDALADFRPRLKQHVVRLKIAVHDALAPDLSVALEDLPEDQDCLLLRQSIGGAFHVLRQRSSLEKLSDEVDVVLLDDHINQTYYVFMCGVIELAEVAESCYLAAEQVPGDFVVDVAEVDGLDGYFDLRGGQEEAQVDVSRGALPQELRVHHAVFVADGAGLLQLHASSIMQITDPEEELIQAQDCSDG